MTLLRLWLGRLILLAGGLHLAVTYSPLVPWWSQALSHPWQEGNSGTLIVLTASEVQPGLMGYSTYWRGIHAVRAWRTGKFHQILISGRYSNAPLAALLEAHGVPHDRILREPVSLTTHENALFTRQLLPPNPGQLTLLTSDFHTYRAFRVFRRAGLSVQTRPAPDAGKRCNQLSERWLVAAQLAEETVKLIYYGWKGRL